MTTPSSLAFIFSSKPVLQGRRVTRRRTQSRDFARQGAVRGAENPQDGKDDEGDNAKHAGLQHLSDFFQVGNEKFSFFEGIIEVQRGAHGALNLVGVKPGMDAVLPGADHDAGHLVEHQGDAVRVDPLDIEGDDPAAQAAGLPGRSASGPGYPGFRW